VLESAAKKRSLAQNAAPADGLKGIDLKHHLKVVRMRFWTLILCAAVVFTLFATYAFRATPMYEASARLLIERQMPQVSPFQSVAGGWQSNSYEYFETQVKLITSEVVLQRALEDREAAALFQNHYEPDVSRNGLVKSIAREISALFSPPTMRLLEPWEKLRGHIEAKPVLNSNLVDVRAVDMSPRSASLIANAVAQAYVAYSVAVRKVTALEMYKMLQDQKREQEQALKKAEDELQAYRETAGAVASQLSSPDKESPSTDRLRALSGQYTTLQLRGAELNITVLALDRAWKDRADTAALLAFEPVRTDSGVQAVQECLAKLETDLQAARATYGVKHPTFKALEEQRVGLLDEMRRAIAGSIQAVQMTARMVAKQENEVLEALNAENARAFGAASTLYKHERLQDNVARQRRVFDVILDRMKEIDLTKDAEITNVTIAERALTPRLPFVPNKARVLILGALLGLLTGLGAAHLLNYLDDTIKTPEDVEESLGVPSLGYVPHLNGGGNGDGERATHSLRRPYSSVGEAFRSISTHVHFSGENGGRKALLVTSSAPGDGKTLVASNLAAIMAQDGKRVLLIDTDLRHPTIHDVLSLNREPGLSNILVEGKPLDDLVQKTAVLNGKRLENLHVLCAGAKTPNPAKLLSGQAMAAFMRETRGKYDMVIYDSCPTPFVADNAPLSNGTDGVIMVVTAARTRRDSSLYALRQLEAVNASVIGVVINQARTTTAVGHYSNSHYGYHRYYNEDAGAGETDGRA